MKKLLKQIKEFIIINILQKPFEFFKQHSSVAVNVTQKIKVMVESPVADIVTDIIPTDVDDKIHEKLKVLMPKIAYKVAVAHNILSVSDNHQESITLVIEELKKLNKENRVGFWILFAGELNKALSDDRLTISEAVTLTQLVYSEYKGTK